MIGHLCLQFPIIKTFLRVCIQSPSLYSLLFEKIKSISSDGKMENNTSRTLNSACAGCKTQRKKCSEKCVLAPFFRQDDLQKFLLVKRTFGSAHVIKLLQGLPAEHRSDAVRSMVYEAKQRLRDPVNGSLGVINDLEKKNAELQSKLDSTEAQLSNINVQHANLLTLITRGDEVWGPLCYQQENIEDMDVDELWESLWT